MQLICPTGRANAEASLLTQYSALFLFFAVGLGVDLSHLYLAKTELQNTADAAALAGASALNLATNPVPTAVDRAIQVMNLNKYNFNNKNYVDQMTLANQRALVRFAVNLSEFDNGGNGLSEAQAITSVPAVRFIRVFTPDVPISIFFSIPILGVARDLSAKAVAGLSVPGNLSTCIAPLSAVSCPPGDTTCSLCDTSDPLYPNCTQSKYWGSVLELTRMPYKRTQNQILMAALTSQRPVIRNENFVRNVL